MESETTKVMITLPMGLLDEFDKQISDAKYGSRSEAMREAMRDLIQKLHKRR